MTLPFSLLVCSLLFFCLGSCPSPHPKFLVTNFSLWTLGRDDIHLFLGQQLIVTESSSTSLLSPLKKVDLFPYMPVCSMCRQVIHILVTPARRIWVEMLFRLLLATLLIAGLHLLYGGPCWLKEIFKGLQICKTVNPPHPRFPPTLSHPILNDSECQDGASSTLPPGVDSAVAELKMRAPIARTASVWHSCGSTASVYWGSLYEQQRNRRF